MGWNSLPRDGEAGKLIEDLANVTASFRMVNWSRLVRSLERPRSCAEYGIDPVEAVLDRPAVKEDTRRYWE